MYLLYMDDSGSSRNANDKHLILAGLCVFERQSHWLSLRLDELAKDIWPSAPEDLEFHGSHMLPGKGKWRSFTREKRTQIFKDALSIIANTKDVRVFAAAVHKEAVSAADPMESAFEQTSSRFDLLLKRLHHAGNTQRGLIVLDKSSYETSLQGLAKDFKSIGHKWGVLNNLADVPLFVDSRATRMIQYADLIAYAFRRYYENGDSAFVSILEKKIDSEGGRLHGLVHLTPERGRECNCLACRHKKR